MMVFGMLYSDLVGLSRRHVDWGEQSVGESVLAQDGFFLRSFGIEFSEVAEWETRLLVGSYGISLQVK